MAVCIDIASMIPGLANSKELIKAVESYEINNGYDKDIYINDEKMTSYIEKKQCNINDELFSSFQMHSYFDRCVKIVYQTIEPMIASEKGALSDNENTAVVLGSGLSTVKNQMDFIQNLEMGGLRKINPMQFPNTVYNCPAGRLSILLKLSGSNTTKTDGLCSGVNALITGSQMISNGLSNTVLALGVEELSEYTMIGYRDCVYDKIDESFLPVESAGAILFMSEEECKAKNIKGLGKIISSNTSHFSGDVSDIEAFSKLIYKNILKTIGSSNIEPGKIGVVYLSRNGIKDLDDAEFKALGKVMRELETKTAVFALKKVIGEAGGATGLLQGILAFSDVNIPFDKHYQHAFSKEMLEENKDWLVNKVYGKYSIIVNIDWVGHISTILVERY